MKHSCRARIDRKSRAEAPACHSNRNLSFDRVKVGPDSAVPVSRRPAALKA
jgi:hypothetical protein